ncbi:MAG: right-handed parallel beta-helix repeat-containing protein [Candidatus Eisenbacteria bacterium]|nr:right-handed parallel beta-helix repeat-containing protein [Candidatus Eisenbacteria bacterium]
MHQPLPQPLSISKASILIFRMMLLTCLSLTPVLAADSVMPGEIEENATIENVDFKWFIEGDDNLDCSVQVEYRKGSLTEWTPAQPLLRVEPGSYNDDNIDPGNLLAGSIFNLNPDTEYDFRLTLSDPDGGTAVETRTVRTRHVPQDPANPRIRYVIPGGGGGSGTEADPFQGISTANAAAEPGDIFILEPGVYTGVAALTTCGTPENPIVWRGTDVSQVIFDGESITKPVVDLTSSEYVHLEQVSVIRPKHMAIRGYTTTGVVIRKCMIDVTVPTTYEMGGIYLLGAGHRDALISENIIQGHLNWEDGRDEDAYAINVLGKGHVISFNEIYDWYDAIHIGAGDGSIETSSCDVYGNEIYNCTDDGIETDGSRHNIRVYKNRFTNVLTGISCQPIYGGPVYIHHNVVYNWQLKPLKFHLWPTGIIVYNNTFVGADPRGWGGGQWRNTIARNNLFLGGSNPGYSGNPICLYTEGVRADLDWNGWYQAYEGRFADFNGPLYPTLEDFQSATGMELNAKLIDISIFLDAEEPILGPYLGEGGFFEPYDPGSQDLRLAPGCTAVDGGIILDNIHDNVSGLTADLGAYEEGYPIPGYGPEGAEPTAGINRPIAVSHFQFYNASPNPFRDLTTLRFDLSISTSVTISIYDLTGRTIRTLAPSAYRSSGPHSLVWDGRDDQGRDIQSGVYFCRISAGDEQKSRKLVLLRE